MTNSTDSGKHAEPLAPHWVVDGPDGKGVLLYDENSPDETQRILVYGAHKEGLAQDLAEFLNTVIKDQGGAA